MREDEIEAWEENWKSYHPLQRDSSPFLKGGLIRVWVKAGGRAVQATLGNRHQNLISVDSTKLGWTDHLGWVRYREVQAPDGNWLEAKGVMNDIPYGFSTRSRADAEALFEMASTNLAILRLNDALSRIPPCALDRAKNLLIDWMGQHESE